MFSDAWLGRFSEELEATVTVVAYAEFENVIEIDLQVVRDEKS